MNKLKNQKGQALVEFAFVLTIILMLAIGAAELARAWYYDNALDNAVRAGVRFASTLTNPNVTNGDTRVQSYVVTEFTNYIPSIPNGFTASNVTVTVRPLSLLVGSKNSVEVTASYTFDISILSSLNSLASVIYKGPPPIPASLTLLRTGTMYYEES